MRQRLLATFAESSVQALALTSLPDLEAGIEAARGRGDAVGLVCHAGHPDLPGIELLSRLRTLDTSAPAVLLMAADWPVARQSAVRDRAFRLGARMVALLDGAEDAAADLATRVAALLTSIPPAAEGVAPGTASESLDIETESPPVQVRRRREDLATLARMLAAAGETAEITGQILEVASEHFSRCFVIVSEGGHLEPLGAAAEGRPALPGSFRSRALSTRGADFLSKAIRDCVPLDGQLARSPDDAALAAMIGASPESRLTLLPLIAAGTCYGALLAFTPEGPATDDLATLSSFTMEAGPALWEALSRERRRIEARRLRTAP